MLLNIENLSYKNLFQNVSFKIDKWIIGITWPSGSWKTTFLKIVWWFIKPDNWEVKIIKNKKIYNIKQWKTFPQSDIIISFHFQDYLLLDLDVKTNIELPFILNNYPKDENWVNYLIDYFEVKKIYNKKIENLSWWEKERISIIRCFASKPNIALIDEAGASLDTRLKNKLYKFIGNYSKDNIIFAISHDNKFRENFNLEKNLFKQNFQIYTSL